MHIGQPNRRHSRRGSRGGGLSLAKMPRPRGTSRHRRSNSASEVGRIKGYGVAGGDTVAVNARLSRAGFSFLSGAFCNRPFRDGHHSGRSNSPADCSLWIPHVAVELTGEKLRCARSACSPLPPLCSRRVSEYGRPRCPSLTTKIKINSQPRPPAPKRGFFFGPHAAPRPTPIDIVAESAL
jgi:hypothetical protein